MSEPPSIKGFIKAFGLDLLTGMSGPLTVPFTIAAFVVPQRWAKVSFAILAITAGVVASYRIWAHERKQLVEAEQKIGNLTRPSDRPRLAFVGWSGAPPPNQNIEFGFWLDNDGGTALEVQVQDFKIDGSLWQSGVIPRIENLAQRFGEVYSRDNPLLSRYNLRLSLVNAAKTRGLWPGKIYRFPVVVVYRDYSDLWYRSSADLEFDCSDSQIRFTAPQQDCLGPTKPPKVVTNDD